MSGNGMLAKKRLISSCLLPGVEPGIDADVANQTVQLINRQYVESRGAFKWLQRVANAG